MTFDSVGGAQALLSVLAGLSGLSGSQIGVPESIGGRIYGTVTAASQAYKRVGLGQHGLTVRDTRYTLTLAYRVDGQEAAAELALMGLLDDLVGQLAIGTDLGGDAGRIIALDTGLADTPEYQAVAGKEFRQYPILVTVQQKG